MPPCATRQTTAGRLTAAFALRMSSLRLLACALLCGAVAMPGRSAAAEDPCAGFKWDISAERGLFAGSAVAIKAATTRAAAPPLSPDRLYRIELVPQAQVAFIVPPGKQMTRDDTYGGLVLLKVRSPGSHRVAVDTPLWLDVIAAGKLVAPEDYEGQQSCTAPRKIVVFPLPGGRSFLLQISGSTSPVVALTLVRPAP